MILSPSKKYLLFYAFPQFGFGVSCVSGRVKFKLKLWWKKYEQPALHSAAKARLSNFNLLHSGSSWKWERRSLLFNSAPYSPAGATSWHPLQRVQMTRGCQASGRALAVGRLSSVFLSVTQGGLRGAVSGRHKQDCIFPLPVLWLFSFWCLPVFLAGELQVSNNFRLKAS